MCVPPSAKENLSSGLNAVERYVNFHLLFGTNFQSTRLHLIARVTVLITRVRKYLVGPEYGPNV